MAISVDQFREYVATTAGTKFRSIGERAQFTISTSHSGFKVLLDNGKRRNVSGSNIRRVLEIFKSREIAEDARLHGSDRECVIRAQDP